MIKLNNFCISRLNRSITKYSKFYLVRRIKVLVLIFGFLISYLMATLFNTCDFEVFENLEFIGGTQLKLLHHVIMIGKFLKASKH
jgi:hypothetical protein